MKDFLSAYLSNNGSDYDEIRYTQIVNDKEDHNSDF